MEFVPSAKPEPERSWPRLKQRCGRRRGKLGREAGGVPVLPGFDEVAIFDADDGYTGDGGGLAGGLVGGVYGPAKADEIVFGENDAQGDAYVSELRLQAVIEGGEFLGSTDRSMAFVEDAFGREELEDDVATGLIPDVFKPTDGELFVAIKN